MATPLETRGRSATVAAMHGRVDQSLEGGGALERTSSDSQLSRPEPVLTLREIAATSGTSERENTVDTMPSGSHPIDHAANAALVSETAASDGTAEEDAAARAIAEAEAVRAEMSTSSTSKAETSAQPPASTGTATQQSQEQSADETGRDEADGAATVAVREKDASKGAVKFDPWLEKVIPEEEATSRDSQPTFSRFFAFASNRPDGVATRVSRWMPFDSQSDAKAASRRSATDWWQTPEEPEEAAIVDSAQVTDNAQVTELPPSNPFAADVKRSAEAKNEAAGAGKDESEEKKDIESSENVRSQADGATGNAAASASAERDDLELSPADDDVASSSAVASVKAKDEATASGAVTTMASSTMLDDKKLEDSWKLMLKSALLSNMASRDKHSSAVEFHPYILLLKEDKLCIHHVPEFFREVSGKKSTYAEQVGKRQALMEIKLEPSMRFGNVERKRVLRDSRARLHIAKLQSWQQRENKGLRALLRSSSRTEVRTILKIGSGSLTALESFIESIDRQIRLMPVDMSQEISFRRDEIYCDLVDDCDIMLAFDGTLLSRRSTVHVMVQAYLSGQADCQMVLNDRKLANEHRNNPSGVFLPASKDLIDMGHVECHSATNREVFEQSRLVRFTCLKGLRFEALRFKVTGSLPPPLEVRGLLCETVDNVVNLRANLKWHPQSGRVRFAVHDVEFHIPVPSSWCGILETKNALGMRRSIKAKNSFRGSIRRKRQTTSASLDVSVGSAKYEPESEALVWRIEDFPTERNTHTTLTCRLELSPSMERANFENKQCIMRYGVAGSCVSGTTVWSLQVPSVQVKPAKKWVKYDTKFRYLIDMLPSSKYEIAGEDD